MLLPRLKLKEKMGWMKSGQKDERFYGWIFSSCWSINERINVAFNNLCTRIYEMNSLRKAPVFKCSEIPLKEKLLGTE